MVGFIVYIMKGKRYAFRLIRRILLNSCEIMAFMTAENLNILAFNRCLAFGSW